MNNDGQDLSVEERRDSSLETMPSDYFLWGEQVISSEDDEDEFKVVEYKGCAHLSEGKIRFEVKVPVRQNYSSFLDKFFYELIKLLEEKPELYQEFYPLINQEFENNSFHYDKSSWEKLSDTYNLVVNKYKAEVESFFHQYNYSCYFSEEAETRENYEMEFLEIFQTMKAYYEAYVKELTLNRDNLNCFPHIQSQDYPRGIPRAIPREQLMLLSMFGGSLTVEKIDEVIAEVEASKHNWKALREQIAESEQLLKSFCTKKEIVTQYIENLRDASELNSTLLEKFWRLIEKENSLFYLWEVDEHNSVNLKLRREPTGILAMEPFKKARHFIMGIGNNIFDIVDFNDIKTFTESPKPWIKASRKGRIDCNLSNWWRSINKNSSIIKEESKGKTVHFDPCCMASSLPSDEDDTDDESGHTKGYSQKL